MFLDSTITKNSQLSKTKYSYGVTFGVAPYVRNVLKEMIKIPPFLTIVFDVNWDSCEQKEQMDIKIRFWSDDERQVTTPYYDSNILTCSNAENSNTLVERMDELWNKNCIMLLMDGPNANWSVLGKVSSQLKQIQLLSFSEVCCYGLHTVYGGFQTGTVSTKRHLGKVLDAIWKLFKDSPVRRDNYKTINGSVEFPSVLAKLVGLKMREWLPRPLKFDVAL